MYRPAVFVLTLALHVMSVAGEPTGTSATIDKLEQRALDHLRKVTSALQLGKTELGEVAGDFAVEKPGSLHTWEDALKYAHQNLGDNTKKRAIFLRKFLKKGTSMTQASHLGLHRQFDNPSIQTGPRPAKMNTSFYTVFSFGPIQKRKCYEHDRIMVFWTQADEGRFISNHYLTLQNPKFKGHTFQEMCFDSEDMLNSYSLATQPDDSGMRIVVGANRSGDGGDDFYYAYFQGKTGWQHRCLMFDANLRLFRRTIYNPATGNMTTCERYREGRLKEKQVYEETQASDGTIKLKMVRHERF